MKFNKRSKSGPISPTSPLTPPPPTITNLSKWEKLKHLGWEHLAMFIWDSIGVFSRQNHEGSHHTRPKVDNTSEPRRVIKEVSFVSDDRASKNCLKQLNQETNHVLNQLSHPNIVQYYESELGEESLSVYLDYVSGGSIHKLLQQYGPFNEPLIQNYTSQIVSGLAYLHATNTVHRDIKGANILVGLNGEIKLADFGMAKHINSSTSSLFPFKFSPYWMAPEVIRNTNGYSLPVDIWSLGCTVLEMASSKPPWSQYEGAAAILLKIGNNKDMPEIPEHLSNDAKNFIMSCLQRDPLARATAHQLLQHPLIRDQSDGIRMSPPPVLELHSHRRSRTSLDGNSALAAPLAIRSPRDNTRMITSLPVSPSSKPSRQYGQNSYNFYGMPLYPTRSNATYTLDP